MIESLIVFVCALFAGTASGIMPGVGGLVAMTTAFPFLMELQPHNVLLFYVVLVSMDQYFNNITAIVFGMPGHGTAVPSVIEGHTLFRQGHGSTAITNSAIASWLCSLFAVFFVLTIAPLMFVMFSIMTTKIQALLFGVAVASIVAFSSNRIWWNALLFCIGLFLGYVGYDQGTNTHNFTFGYVPIYGGLPTLSVIVSCFIVPMFLRNYLENKSAVQWPTMEIKNYWYTFKNIARHWTTILRCAVIGSLGGFVPGLTYSASSLFAYSTERSVQMQKGDYKQGNIKCLIAAEGSNNAGAFTQMVPLIFLGIPITASEAMIYNILTSKGSSLSIEWFQSTYPLVMCAFFVSSCIGLFVAGKYINIFRFLDGFSVGKLYALVLCFLLFMVWLTGNQTMNGFDNLLMLFGLIPLGLLLHRLDTSPLIFGFLLQDIICDTSERIQIFYFT